LVAEKITGQAHIMGSVGEPVRATDADGRVTTFAYDGLGR
jgi:hypothetical protein